MNDGIKVQMNGQCTVQTDLKLSGYIIYKTDILKNIGMLVFQNIPILGYTNLKCNCPINYSLYKVTNHQIMNGWNNQFYKSSF
jgi:hypothetical protein